MGYNTIFKGELKFTSEPTAKQLSKLNSMFGEDCREHPEWGRKDLSYIDLLITDDFTGIRWDDGTEKTYNLEQIVNVVLFQMRKEYPDFGLSGFLSAQGEDAEDRWDLFIGDDGFAHKRMVPIPGTKVQCPSCDHRFYVEGLSAGKPESETK